MVKENGTRTYYSIDKAADNTGTSNETNVIWGGVSGTDAYYFKYGIQIRGSGLGRHCIENGTTYYEKLSIVARVTRVQLYRKERMLHDAGVDMATLNIPGADAKQLSGIGTAVRYTAAAAFAASEAGDVWTATANFNSLEGHFLKSGDSVVNWHQFTAAVAACIRGKIISR